MEGRTHGEHLYGDPASIPGSAQVLDKKSWAHPKEKKKKSSQNPKESTSMQGRQQKRRGKGRLDQKKSRRSDIHESRRGKNGVKPEAREKGRRKGVSIRL